MRDPAEHAPNQEVSDPDVSTFAQQLSKLLRGAKMSQIELAERLGCSPSYISKIVHGQNVPGASFTEALADIFRLGKNARKKLEDLRRADGYALRRARRMPRFVSEREREETERRDRLSQQVEHVLRGVHDGLYLNPPSELRRQGVHFGWIPTDKEGLPPRTVYWFVPFAAPPEPAPFPHAELADLVHPLRRSSLRASALRGSASQPFRERFVIISERPLEIPRGAISDQQQEAERIRSLLRGAEVERACSGPPIAGVSPREVALYNCRIAVRHMSSAVGEELTAPRCSSQLMPMRHRHCLPAHGAFCHVGRWEWQPEDSAALTTLEAYVGWSGTGAAIVWSSWESREEPQERGGRGLSFPRRSEEHIKVYVDETCNLSPVLPSVRESAVPPLAGCHLFEWHWRIAEGR